MSTIKATLVSLILPNSKRSAQANRAGFIAHLEREGFFATGGRATSEQTGTICGLAFEASFVGMGDISWASIIHTLFDADEAFLATNAQAARRAVAQCSALDCTVEDCNADTAGDCIILMIKRDELSKLSLPEVSGFLFTPLFIDPKSHQPDDASATGLRYLAIGHSALPTQACMRSTYTLGIS